MLMISNLRIPKMLQHSSSERAIVIQVIHAIQVIQWFRWFKWFRWIN